MKVYRPLIFLFFFAGYNCFAQSSKDSVIVLPIKAAVPANARKVGSIKVGNNATATHCDYEGLVQEAKDKARAMNGNIVKITRLVAPAFISKCYRIEADIYFVNELPAYPVQKTANDNASISSNNYAMLYIYRLKDTVAFATSYYLHLNNDSVICTIKNKSRDSVKIYKAGKVKLWAETEKKTELTLDVKFGAVYYIRCGLEHGEMRMVPNIALVDNNVGAGEYGKQLHGKKDMDVKYLQQIH